MEPELEDQVPLEQARRVVGEPAAAEVGVDRERAEVRDPVALARELVPHGARALPVDADDEPAEPLRLRPRPLDLRGDVLARSRPVRAQEGLDVRMRGELDEEVDIVGIGPPQLDHAGWAAADRRGRRSAPEPVTIPSRIRASPASATGRSGSPRTTTP